MNSFSKPNLKSTGFTGVEVFNETMEDIFKGTTAAESFLYITVTDTGKMLIKKLKDTAWLNTLCSDNKTILAENSFFPSNFTSVDLSEAKLAATSFSLSSNNTVTVSE